jgi:hypothetical protein
MNKKVFYLVVMSCLLFAGQAGAQKTLGFLKKSQKTQSKAPLHSSLAVSKQFVFPTLSGTRLNNLAAQQVSRPTTIYRDEYSSGRKLKYECEYDTYGHVTSVKLYVWDDSHNDYIFLGSSENEYLQLPNGEFVPTKVDWEYKYSDEYTEKRKYTASYDSKGMELWSQEEFYDFELSTWNIHNRTEALIENGVRTAILYNGEVDDQYTFDSKGRIIRDNYSDNYYSSEIFYEWNNNDRLIRVVESSTRDSDDDGIADYVASYTYDNIQIVYNEKYFDSYSLTPFTLFDDRINVWEEISWGDFSIDDYSLHIVYYNLDATVMEDGEEMQGQIRTTVNASQNQIKRETIIGSEVIGSETTYLLDGYGSYRILEEYDDWTNDRSVTYNEYGELMRESDTGIETDENNEEWLYGYEYVYDREYDAQNRPVRTTLTSNRFEESSDANVTYEETYDTWTTIELLFDIQETVEPAVLVYPNPATDYIVIDNADKADITISDLSGRIVHRQTAVGNKENIPVASLVQGIYIVTVQANNYTIVNKFIKK